MSQIGRIHFFVAILIGSAIANGAHAQKPKVVVMSFAGDGGPTARVQVVRALKGRADFATKSDADAIIRDRGLRLGTAADRGELGDALDVDYIFWGRVKGKGSGARTELRVAGRSGEALTGYEAGAPGTSKGNQLIQEAARTALAEAMELAPPEKRKRKEAPAVSAVAGGSVAAGAAAGASPAPSTPPASKPRKGDKTDDKKKKKRSAESGSELPVFEILAGGGMRFIEINFNVGDVSGGLENRNFTSGAYADVGGYFLVRPLGRSDNPALQGMVIQGDGGVGFGLSASPEGTGIKVDVNTWRALGQVGYLYPIKGMLVGGLAGVGVDTFDIEVNSVLPSIQYIYFRVGATFAYTIIDDFLGFRVDGGFRKPFSLGDIDAAFGNNSSAIGWDATAMVGGKLDIGFSYGFRFIYESYKLDFAGATQNVPARSDMCPPDSSCGGTDRAMTFQFLVGWSL